MKTCSHPPTGRTLALSGPLRRLNPSTLFVFTSGRRSWVRLSLPDSISAPSPPNAKAPTRKLPKYAVPACLPAAVLAQSKLARQGLARRVVQGKHALLARTLAVLADQATLLSNTSEQL